MVEWPPSVVDCYRLNLSGIALTTVSGSVVVWPPGVFECLPIVQGEVDSVLLTVRGRLGFVGSVWAMRASIVS